MDGVQWRTSVLGYPSARAAVSWFIGHLHVLQPYHEGVYLLLMQFNIVQTGDMTQQVLGNAVATHPVSSAVRDLKWIEGTEYMIVTTDETVRAQVLDYLQVYTCIDRSYAVITTGISAPTGNMLPVQQLLRVCWNEQVSTVWVVYSGEQVFSEVPVPEQQ